MRKLSASFRALWLGQALANLADAFYIMAIVTLIYKQTGSAAYSATVPVLRVGAQMASGLLAPLLLDRFPLRGLLIASQGGQTGLLLLLALIIGNFESGIPLILSVVFAVSFLDGWTVPARNAMIPRLVALVKANSWLSTTDQTMMLLGWSTGGLLVAWMGNLYTLWITILLFSVSSFLLVFIRDPEGKPIADKKEPLSNWYAIKDSWSTIWSNPVLRRVTLMDLIETLSASVWVGAILLVFVKEVLHRGEIWWGYINASYYAGTLLGGLVVIALSRRLSAHLAVGMFIGAAGNSLLTFVFAFVPIPAVSLILCLLMGPLYQLRDIAQRTLFQQTVSPSLLPKVVAAHGALMYGIFGLSIFLVGIASDLFGIRTIYIGTALLLACSSFLSLPLLRRTHAESKNQSPDNPAH
ncbi:MFS transporter [Salinithrix halophila]|uniref:MFS transporter n=1 Tax=Salinithrix halophila TaxID=1485204 RepID=A0ABV8JB52_9BACL